MQLHIPDMTCGGCARSVSAAIKELDPAATIDIDLASKQVRVESTQAAGQITQALDEAGFSPQLLAD